MKRVLSYSFYAQLALAFCDWSDVQKARRDMLTAHTFPRKFSMSFDRFSEITLEYLQQLSVDIRLSMERQKSVDVKPLVNATCANVFAQYFTSRSFEKSDKKFSAFIRNFDKIFWEVNQGKNRNNSFHLERRPITENFPPKATHQTSFLSCCRSVAIT